MQGEPTRMLFARLILLYLFLSTFCMFFGFLFRSGSGKKKSAKVKKSKEELAKVRVCNNVI